MSRKERRKVNRAIARNIKKTTKNNPDKIQQVAEEFVRLEKEIKAGINIKSNEHKMAELTEQLSILEIFAIDEYIESHKMLTK